MKYCPEIVEKICKSIIELKGRINAAKEAGISYETFTTWMGEKLDFSDAIKKAEDQANTKGKEVAIMSIFRAMPNQWQAGAWWLERKHKKEFAKEETLNQNFNDTTTPKTIDELKSELERLEKEYGNEKPILPSKRDVRVRSNK